MRPPKTPYLPKAQNGLLHYPFGMNMQTYANIDFAYSYGMNTQEKDDEIYGKGNSYSAEYWQYDARLGRRWNVDPVDKLWESSYACFWNNPIRVIDPNGDDGYVDEGGNYLGDDGNEDSHETRVVSAGQWGNIVGSFLVWIFDFCHAFL